MAKVRREPEMEERVHIDGVMMAGGVEVEITKRMFGSILSGYYGDGIGHNTERVGPMLIYATIVRVDPSDGIEYLYVYQIEPNDDAEANPEGSRIVEATDGSRRDYYLVVRKDAPEWETEAIERWLRGGPDNGGGVGHALHDFERVSPGVWRSPTTAWKREVEKDANGIYAFGPEWYRIKP